MNINRLKLCSLIRSGCLLRNRFQIFKMMHYREICVLNSSFLVDNFNRINGNSMQNSLLKSSQTTFMQLRLKSKDKKREKQTDHPKVILDAEEMDQVYQFDDLKLAIDAMINEFKNDLKLNYNIKMNPAVIESLEISYDGVKTTIGDLVNIVRKQNDLVINLSASPSAVKPAVNAINEAGLNVTVQQNGHMIYLKMPKVTNEHRQALIKSVKQAGQQMKDRLKDKNFHKRFLTTKDLNKLSQDLVHNANQNLMFYIKQKCSEVDEISKHKIDSLE